MTVIGALSSFRKRGEMSPHKRPSRQYSLGMRKLWRCIGCAGRASVRAAAYQVSCDGMHHSVGRKWLGMIGMISDGRPLVFGDQ